MLHAFMVAPNTRGLGEGEGIGSSAYSTKMEFNATVL